MRRSRSFCRRAPLPRDPIETRHAETDGAHFDHLARAGRGRLPVAGTAGTPRRRDSALIGSMMLAGGPDKSALPRDTIFSSIRIICNGAAGLCVLLGGLKPITGIVIALLVLLPETGAAVRAARADRLQTSLNLSLGSAMASTSLTIPAVALASVTLGLPLQLGLSPKDLVLPALTFAGGAITFGTGRTKVLQGAVHLVIFAAFLFLSLVP